MVAPMKGRWIGLFSVVAACSSRGGSLDLFLDGAVTSDVTAVDLGASPNDTGTSPNDTGTGPDDAGFPTNDVGTPPTDTGTPPVDTGPMTECTIDSECAALGRVCDRVMNRCVECIADADCARGRFCPPSHVCTVQVCAPNESSCVSTSRQSVCNSRGSAQVESACASGETCRSGRCQPTACTPGATTCDEATGGRRVCNAEGSGTALIACPSGQRCRDNVCAALACTPGSRTCVGTSLRTCNSSGTEATTMVCPPLPNATGDCAIGTCGFVCQEGFGDCNRTFSDGCEAPLSTNTNCGACGRACTAGQTCSGGTCIAGTTASDFRVTSLGATNCRVSGHETASGDDRGGIAVSSDALYYTGDTATVRANLDLISTATVGVRHDGIFSDLGTGDVYVLLSAAGTQPSYTAATMVVTQLGRLNSAGTLSTTRIPLSTPFTIYTNNYGGGVFAGVGQVIIFAGPANPTASPSGNWYSISLPSGTVRLVGTFGFPTHNTCENWAAWGIAESVGGDLSVVYAESGTAIARMRLADRSVTRIAEFTNINETCSITLSPTRNRWYFHSEYETQFSTTTRDELWGFCDATWTATP